MHLDDRSDIHYQLSNPGGDCTSSSYPARIPVVDYGGGLVSPATGGVVVAGDGLIPCGNGGALSPFNLELVPIGVGSATDTFLMTVLGWRSTTGSLYAGAAKGKLWIPVSLGAYTVTLGTGVGVSGADVDQTHLFATTISQSYGPTVASGSVVLDSNLYTPGSNAIGMILMRVQGFRYIEVIFNMNSSSTSANCLFAKR